MMLVFITVFHDLDDRLRLFHLFVTGFIQQHHGLFIAHLPFLTGSSELGKLDEVSRLKHFSQPSHGRLVQMGNSLTLYLARRHFRSIETETLGHISLKGGRQLHKELLAGSVVCSI